MKVADLKDNNDTFLRQLWIQLIRRQSHVFEYNMMQAKLKFRDRNIIFKNLECNFPRDLINGAHKSSHIQLTCALSIHP